MAALIEERFNRAAGEHGNFYIRRNEVTKEEMLTIDRLIKDMNLKWLHIETTMNGCCFWW